MEGQPACDIIIPTYNGSRHIPRLLTSIRAQQDVRCRCFVIDDCSGDGTPELVRRRFPWVELIEQPRNFGPAHNRNVAVRSGSYPYVVIFDDDTYLDDPGWLKRALRYMEENPDVGQAAAMIVSGFDRNVLLDCGIGRHYYLFGGRFHNEHAADVGGAHLLPGRVLGACSAGTVLRREVFERIGGFDAAYFYPVEDLDLSLRVHLAGYDVRYLPTLVVYHYESQAMGKAPARKMYMYRRNCLLAVAENYPALHVLHLLLVVIGREIGIAGVRCLARKLGGRPAGSLAASMQDYLKAMGHLLINSPGIIRKRRAVDGFRTRPRKYLLEVNEQAGRDRVQ